MFHIVYNLYPFSEGFFLPSANIVQIDKGGEYSHIIQRALPTTISAYQIEQTAIVERLFQLIDLLGVKQLETKFKPPKAKVNTPLDKLLADTETKKVIESYVFRNLDLFLSEIAQNRLPLTLDAEKKTLAKDVLIHFPKEDLLPHLYFNKSDTGIEYRLQLGTETEKWNIREHQVVPLTNTDPAWILVAYALFRVVGINGNMVKPFRQKDSVIIPLDKEKIYFRQFIAKSISRSRVEAEGFQVLKADTLRSTRLEIIENILEKSWLLRPVFEYDGATFQYGDRRERITSIDIPETDDREITVHLISRNADLENTRMEYLVAKGLTDTDRLFSLTETIGDQPAQYTGLYELIQWAALHAQDLETSGFKMVSPEVDGKNIALLAGSITVNTEAAGDWFDVRGNITVGEHQFSFLRLLPNLRSGNPFFLLPDGHFFMIPSEWFTRYADLATSLQVDGEQMRLPKALFTLLQAVEPEAVAEQLPLIDPEKIDYTPSENLVATLRPYQLTGTKWLIGHYQQGLGACLADDMGLGKTLQTIALLLYAKEQEKTLSEGLISDSGAQMDIFQAHREALKPLTALIILPASLVFNWQRELSRFAPSLFVYAHVGPKRLKDARALSSHDVILTTYHTARQDLSLLEQVDWHFIILDESQQIKNRDSEISKVVRGLRSARRISLSGTPIENSLADLWTQMEFINPATLGTYPAFKEQFQVPIERHQDERAKARLYARVKPFFLRRTKEEVAPDLPALSQQIFYTEMAADQRKRYEQLKSAVRNEILSLFDDPKTRLQALQALMRLRQLANHPLLTDADYTGESGKLNDVMAQWDVIQRAGHKVLFFSSFEQHLQIYRRIFEAQKIPYAWLSGDTATKDRAAAVERFQEDVTVQAFFITMKAGGIGLNLTASDYVFVLDPWWNPAVEDQAIARAHRIGQTRPVTALRYIARDTIEEKIIQLQERKRLLGKDLFGAASEFPTLDRDDLEMLLG